MFFGNKKKTNKIDKIETHFNLLNEERIEMNNIVNCKKMVYRKSVKKRDKNGTKLTSFFRMSNVLIAKKY